MVEGLDYVGEMGNFFGVFREMQMNVDTVFVTQLVDNPNLLNGYKIVISPCLVAIDTILTSIIEDFVSKGGIFITTYRSGHRDLNNTVTDQVLPGYES